MEEIDVLITDPPEISFSVFELWLAGFSLDEASYLTIKEDISAARSDFVGEAFTDDDFARLVKLEYTDQYRLFGTLEHHISHPLLLSSQTQIWFQLPGDVYERIVEAYFQFDDQAAREIISKKLARSRRDLEEISEATRLPLVRVTRQFDNLKRMYTLLEESKQFQCNLARFVRTNFLLSQELSRRYSCLLFFVYSKFNIVSKKRMQGISCRQLEKCTEAVMGLLVSDSFIFNSVLASFRNQDDQEGLCITEENYDKLLPPGKLKKSS